jgi:hypothetical protein
MYAQVFRAALWVVGEYSESLTEIRDALSMLKKALGPAPYVTEEQVRVMCDAVLCVNDDVCAHTDHNSSSSRQDRRRARACRRRACCAAAKGWRAPRRALGAC